MLCRMLKKAAQTLGLLLLLTPQVVLAREYYYFNKVGVSRDSFVKDRTTCLELAGAAKVPPSAAYTPYNRSLSASQNAAAAGIAGLLTGLTRGAEERRISLSVERTCMADKGYARFTIDKKTIHDISKMTDETAQLERYFELAAQENPIGKKAVE